MIGERTEGSEGRSVGEDGEGVDEDLGHHLVSAAALHGRHELRSLVVDAAVLARNLQRLGGRARVDAFKRSLVGGAALLEALQRRLGQRAGGTPGSDQRKQATAIRLKPLAPLLARVGVARGTRLVVSLAGVEDLHRAHRTAHAHLERAGGESTRRVRAACC